MSEMWGIPSPKNRAPISQLSGNFDGLYLLNEMRYTQLGKCIGNSEGSPTLSQNVMNFFLKRLKIGPTVLSTLHKFCFLLHCQASQTKIGKRNSTKLCQTVDSINHA